LINQLQNYDKVLDDADLISNERQHAHSTSINCSNLLATVVVFSSSILAAQPIQLMHLFLCPEPQWLHFSDVLTDRSVLESRTGGQVLVILTISNKAAFLPFTTTNTNNLYSLSYNFFIQNL
jgi:hypothetical protein